MTPVKADILSSKDKYLLWRVPPDKSLPTSHVYFTGTKTPKYSSKSKISTTVSYPFSPLGNEIVFFAMSFSKITFNLS